MKIGDCIGRIGRGDSAYIEQWNGGESATCSAEHGTDFRIFCIALGGVEIKLSFGTILALQCSFKQEKIGKTSCKKHSGYPVELTN